MAKLSGGGTLQLTQAQAGCGHTAVSATTLSSPQQALSMHPLRTRGTTSTLPVDLECLHAPAPYTVTELGVYAQDPEVGEILMKVYVLTNPLPIAPTSRSVLRFYLEETRSNTMTLSVQVDPTATVKEPDLAHLRQLAEGALQWVPVHVPSNIVDWCNACKTSSAFHSGPDTAGFPYPGNWLGQLHNSINGGWKMLTALDILTDRIFYRSCNFGDWSAWKEQTAIRPPQEIALPLAAGFAPNGACTMVKTQDNMVSLYGECYKLNGDFGDYTVLATLPAGYRPAALTHVQTTLQDSSGMVYRAGGMKIFPSGKLEVMTDSTVKYCKFSASFLAVQ